MKRWLEKLIERGAVALAIMAGIFWVYGLYRFWNMESQFTRPEALLHRTDYPAIRDACRDLMAKHQRGELPGDLSGHDPRMPDVIRPLRPSYLLISDHMVVVEMHSGSDHYGFRAYPRDSFKEGQEAGWKLNDGLWIYGVDYDPRSGAAGDGN